MLIGIGHKKQVGKDTAAAWLEDNYLFERRAFADRLKSLAFCMIEMPWKIKEWFDDSHRPDLYQIFMVTMETVPADWMQETPKPRKLLQYVGTEFFRTIEDDFWIKEMGHVPERTVIPDVRFINEADWIKNQGGILVKINRHGLQEDTHSSENQLNDYEFDYEINNNGSIAALHIAIERVYTNER